MAAAAGDAHPYPLYNARFRLVLPILDADGDLVTGATAPDSEVSQNQGTFADATNEIVEIATSSGMYYLDLIATEMDTQCSAVIVKTTSAGAKTTPIVLYPKRLPVLRTGTAQAGAATTITLDSGASAKDDFYNGCYVNITNDSPANALGQARLITDYVGSTKVATVESAWGTNPSVASTFEILLTEEAAAVREWGGSPVADTSIAGVPEVDVTHWIGTAAATPTVAGVPEVDVTHWRGTATPAEHTAGYPIVTVKDGTGTGEIDTASGKVSITDGAIVAATFGAGAITATVIATGAIDADAIAADAVTELRSIFSGTADSGSSTTLVDAALAEADTDYWKGCWVLFTSGTISGQVRLITAFTPGTDTITFAPATTQAVGTNTYEILPAARSDVELWDGSAVNPLISGRVDANAQALGTGVIVAGTFGAGAIDAAAIATAAIDADALAADCITAAKIANAAIDAATFASGAIDAAALATDAANEIRDAVWAKVMAELASVPGVTASVLDALQWVFLLARNKVTQTATTQTLRNDADSATVGASTLSDDGTTFTRGEFA